MKKLYFKCISIALFLIITPLITSADGGVFPPPDYWIKETGQRAVIFYENGKEVLILTTDFKGEAKDFAWIIPTPNKPEVTKGSDEIFTSLEKIIRQHRKNTFRIMTPMAGLGLEKTEEAVTVIETKKIDYYDIAILSTTDAKALSKWLNENGYVYPEQSAYILNDYINNNWYFVAVKISPEAEKAEEVVRGLKEGHMTPLKLIFSSEAIIYPLRISAIGEEYGEPPISQSKKESLESKKIPYIKRFSIPIHLYVIADHKKEIPEFTINYANWIDAKTIKNLAYDVNGKSLIEPVKRKYYLTYLYRYMSFSQMTNDLFLRDAPDNKRVNAPNPWLNFFYGTLIIISLCFAWIFSPLGIMFITGLFIDILSKNKAAKIIAKIFQFFSIGLTIIGSIIYLIWLLIFKSTVLNVFTKSIGIGLGIMVLIAAIVYILQKKYLEEK